MPTFTIEYRTEGERLILGQAVAYATALHRLAAVAPHGSVPAACEQLALTDGRELVRRNG